VVELPTAIVLNLLSRSRFSGVTAPRYASCGEVMWAQYLGIIAVGLSAQVLAHSNQCRLAEYRYFLSPFTQNCILSLISFSCPPRGF